jgi:hypothetical protein
MINANSGIVAFSHPIVQEYLEEEKVRKMVFGFEPQVGLSRTYLTFLSYEDFSCYHYEEY